MSQTDAKFESEQQTSIQNQPQTRRVKCVPAGTGPTYWSPGDQVTFLITGKETGGAFFMAEVIVPPGGGNPPHIHRREDETFHLLQGKLTVHVDGETLTASPGDVVHLPRETVHWVQNTGKEDAKLVVLVTPAGFEQFFEEAFYLAADCPVTPPPMTEAFMARFTAAASRVGLEFPPPPQQ